ncbi:MAG: AAA family ATPase [Bacteroidales bacterium]|jgi:exodeoxyribonuclease-5|nr:AAA family ATPase [Bacteroidales bacterium]MCI1785803.1 AAA family ATPase [Bacteroidales bacterium]
MDRSDYFYRCFLTAFRYEPTQCQEKLFKAVADFLTSDDNDILVVNGYAGTGKTSAVSSVISVLGKMKIMSVLLAPTGRAAKVLSVYAGRPAYTIHKHIYRQKSVGDNGYGQFSLAPNKSRDALFVVDEVSLIGNDSGHNNPSLSFGTGNLLNDLVSFVRNGPGCKLILMGDSAQLPPVGLDCSPALSPDYMDGVGGVARVELTTVVRQRKESGILANATSLRGMISSATSGDTCFNVNDLSIRTMGYDDVVSIKGGEFVETLSDAYGKYGEEGTIVLCRSNKRANRYNAGIRAAVQYKEERLVRDDRLMIVKNCYQFLEDVKGLDYIANGDMAKLVRINDYEDRYGLHFAEAELSFPDYEDQEIKAKVILDTLESESASLTYEQQEMLYNGVSADYSQLKTKKKRYDAVREDPYYNALQLKYANAITCHKSQGGQWKCVFIDNPFWNEELTVDDLKWLYTAFTRTVEKVYLINFKDEYFMKP